jgi:hydroxymethylglutaryl-CoA lyase
MHFHDTFGHAADCVDQSIDLGIRSFDSSVAGLGGCPYASKPNAPAPGNLATETLMDIIEARGMTHHANRGFIQAAASFARESIASARQNTGYQS